MGEKAAALHYLRETIRSQEKRWSGTERMIDHYAESEWGPVQNSSDKATEGVKASSSTESHP